MHFLEGAVLHSISPLKLPKKSLVSTSVAGSTSALDRARARRRASRRASRIAPNIGGLSNLKEGEEFTDFLKGTVGGDSSVWLEQLQPDSMMLIMAECVKLLTQIPGQTAHAPEMVMAQVLTIMHIMTKFITRCPISDARFLGAALAAVDTFVCKWWLREEAG